MSVQTFYDNAVTKNTEDRGHNVTARWRNVAEQLRDQMIESEAKTSALFSKMSAQLDAALGKSAVLDGQLKFYRSELAAAEKALKEIWDLTDPYADGTEDSSSHDRLCANVSGLARPWGKPVQSESGVAL